MPLSEAFIRRFGNMTEKYVFYNGEVELRYNVKDHVYMLVTPKGLAVQDGVTSICHIIDKSEILIPWGCKVMGIKLVVDIPKAVLPTGEVVVLQQTLADFELAVQKAKTAHKDKLEDAGEVGHIAHNWVEQWIKAVLKSDDSRKEELLANMPKDERASNGAVAALDWMQRHNVRWISTERKIYSRKYGYAGTLDGLCVVDACDDSQCCPHQFKDRLSISDWKTSNGLYPEYRLQTAAYQQAHQEESGEAVADRWIIRLDKVTAKFEAWHLEAEAFPGDLKAFLDALDLTRSIRAIKADIDARKDVQRTENKRVRVEAKKLKDEAAAEAKKAKKDAAQKAKSEALAIRCKKADKYNGMKKPSCGCQTCEAKYATVQAAKVTDVLQKVLQSREEDAKYDSIYLD